MTTRVLLDANVLFSEPLRRLLFRVADAGILQLHWTLHILDEACGSLVRTERLTGPEARALHTQLTTDHSGALVTGYEPRIAQMANHPSDRHVAAAAAHGAIGLIVTKNLHDFRKLPEALAAISPDALLLRLLDEHAGAMVAVLKAETVTYGSLEALVAEMRKIVPRFAKRVKTMESGIVPGSGS